MQFFLEVVLASKGHSDFAKVYMETIIVTAFDAISFCASSPPQPKVSRVLTIPLWQTSENCADFIVYFLEISFLNSTFTLLVNFYLLEINLHFYFPEAVY